MAAVTLAYFLYIQLADFLLSARLHSTPPSDGGVAAAVNYSRWPPTAGRLCRRDGGGSQVGFQSVHGHTFHLVTHLKLEEFRLSGDHLIRTRVLRGQRAGGGQATHIHVR